ncbi:transglutaminase family protein [Agromyces intestinalis]|uniref:Transglutaminase family protein n=1 Tax=Agromyces intestinalis TaxID=2592652 RepID=A0A5C1YLU0_9MICO|nr:transglutaminase family protein [Agromyces intestinalis]QEO16210.1 transglutaminase family protein [Agromyces intestinalis]
MQRHVSAELVLRVAEPARLAFMVAVSGEASVERLELRSAGRPVAATELTDATGSRIHVVDASPGELTVSYTATVDGRAAPAVASEVDLLAYLRPSRYCESDTLAATAAAEFGGLEGAALLDGVSSWVGTRLAYVPGSSGPTDGAVQTLLSRQGVCRDYAHLVIALLRALGVPARLAAVYAPGLDPMDFHAVAEAHVDGAWRVVDATALAPRSTLVRISTGRDAADTAFLSSYGGAVVLDSVEVSAVADVLPDDDLTEFVELG